MQAPFLANRPRGLPGPWRLLRPQRFPGGNPVWSEHPSAGWGSESVVCGGRGRGRGGCVWSLPGEPCPSPPPWAPGPVGLRDPGFTRLPLTAGARAPATRAPHTLPHLPTPNPPPHPSQPRGPGRPVTGGTALRQAQYQAWQTPGRRPGPRLLLSPRRSAGARAGGEPGQRPPTDGPGRPRPPRKPRSVDSLCNSRSRPSPGPAPPSPARRGGRFAVPF